ncbi:MAG: hypothetical protein HQ518_23160 [Rhodopirellula sp.]|nr:hypothetical protein [Rhodopirellula sp.]
MTLDGTPLTKGTVRFIPINDTSGPKSSVTVVDGQFAVDAGFGPVVGEHRVEIESTDDGGFPLDDESAFERLQESGIQQIDVVRVPSIYNEHSTLTAEVGAGKLNEFTFVLTTPEKQGRRTADRIRNR